MGSGYCLQLVAFFGLIALLTCREIHVERKGIVDEGGYIIRNARVTINETGQDLVLEALAEDSENMAGKVILTPNEGSRSQKWGVAFYGGATAGLFNGLNKNNTISMYLPERGLQRLHARQYSFENCYANEEFKIRNKETDMCLSIVQIETEYQVDLVDCNDSAAKIYWTFERYG